ncbi:hypothetical protein COCON_G00152640 [Conger conger]|uniref:F-box domain-containing protein n=1 Tax=Conger conger TaxID=82655 RepID=A0A9Q1HSV3_CONCO|nr:hypothetical protein COCON_G00152640 [Conger conger]
MGSERTVLSVAQDGGPNQAQTPADGPRTPHLDTLRTKRLQFFCKNQSIQNSLEPKRAAAHADGLSNRQVPLDPLRDEAELDPLLLQDSGVPEHQKLRHVLAWAQNFIRTGPTVPPAVGQGHASPTNSDHPSPEPRPLSQPGVSVYETYLMCVAQLNCRKTQGHKEVQLNRKELQDCTEVGRERAGRLRSQYVDSTEDPVRETHTGLQDGCRSSSEKKQPVEAKKPPGSSWPRRAVSSGSSRRRRFWEKSSMLWSSYAEGTLLPRVKPSARPAVTSCSVAACTPQDSALSSDSSPLKDRICPGTNAPQHHMPGGTVSKPWLSLPDELWMAILKLMSHSDLCHVAQTCHRLCRLANDRTLWQVVRIENSTCLNADWLSSIGRRGPCSLTLCRCTDEHVTPRGLEELFAQSGGSLKELRIVNCSGPGLHGNKLLLPCSRYCPRLTNVDVSWTGATDTGIAALASATSSLESVVVNGCSITDRVFKIIVKRHGRSLRRLEIFGSRSLSAPCLGLMATCCPNLKVVNLGKLPNVTEACLTFIIGRLKQLTSLDLTGLAVVRDQTVHQIARQCPKLQDLTLRCCPSVTDRSLIEISTYSTSIRFLDVSGCSAVTDLGIQAISKACQRLQYLDLSSTKTSNKGVQVLASYGSRHLHTVKISFCYICQDSLRKLCRYHTGLRLLHLYGACDFHNIQELRLINPSLEMKCDLACLTPPGLPH